MCPDVWPIRTPREWLPSSLPHGLRLVTVAVLWGALVGTAGLLIGRRAAGAFDSPLSAAGLLAASLVLTSLAILASRSLVGKPSWSKIRWAPLAVAVAAALAISLPGSSSLGMVLLWSGMVLAGAASLLLGRYSPTTSWSFPMEIIRGGDRGARRRKQIPARSSAMSDAAAGESQWLSRREQAGRETIHGRVLAVVPAGRRSAVAHVAFCPPFPQSPQVDIKPATTPGLTISAGQVLPHGVRLDVKLASPAPRKASVRIEFWARGPIAPGNV
jgi:hypothetical protein